MKKKEEEIEKYCKVNKINKTKEIHIYLNNMIAEPYLYVDFLEQLREVNNNDSVFIHINSNGGYIDTGIQLINGIENCKGKIITILEGAGHSVASLIFLSGKDKRVMQYSYMLCHYYSGRKQGKGQELEAESKFESKFLKDFFRKIYCGFLSNDEIERLIRGEDFWFSAKQIKRRLKNS